MGFTYEKCAGMRDESVLLIVQEQLSIMQCYCAKIWNTLWGKFCLVILLKMKQLYWNYCGSPLE